MKPLKHPGRSKRRALNRMEAIIVTLRVAQDTSGMLDAAMSAHAEIRRMENPTEWRARVRTYETYVRIKPW